MTITPDQININYFTDFHKFKVFHVHFSLNYFDQSLNPNQATIKVFKIKTVMEFYVLTILIKYKDIS